MSDQKTCSNGHLFDDKLDECPYCPAETIVEGDTQLDTDSDSSSDLDKTEILSGDNPDRTLIHKAESEPSASDSGSSHGRKLVGWLVSFTWNKKDKTINFAKEKHLLVLIINLILSWEIVRLRHTTVQFYTGVGNLS